VNALLFSSFFLQESKLSYFYFFCACGANVPTCQQPHFFHSFLVSHDIFLPISAMLEGNREIVSALVNNMDPEQIVATLQHRGYFVLPLSEKMLDTQEEMFRQFEVFDARPVAEKTIFSLSPDAIGENNGWHGAGGLSRYNQCREGIIFQASSPVWPMLSDSIASPSDNFSIAHETFRQETHLLAATIMEQIASALELPKPAAYFTANGPLDIIGGSQFHVKKVMLSESEDFSALHKSREDDRYLTLRAHRDPSVITIVFHKCRTAEAEHGLGLQFQDPDGGSFGGIPLDMEEVAGRAVCVVVAGSILELLSEGILCFMHSIYYAVSQYRSILV
jgi:hypothetical protein